MIEYLQYDALERRIFNMVKRKKQKIGIALVSVVLTTVFFGIVILIVATNYTSLMLVADGDYPAYSKEAVTGQTLFLGDSITEFYRTDDFYNGYTAATGQLVYNRGISGNRTDQVLARLETDVFPLLPKQLVLLIGTNDLFRFRSVEDIAGNVDEIITRCKPYAENIYLVAVFPVTHYKSLFGFFMVNFRTNKKIDKLNVLLKSVAAKQGIPFVDFTSELKDSKNRLKKEYTHDGLHVNRLGYEVYTANILPYISDQSF